MTICDDLRQSVLQAAIQGKLTQQLPEDGTAGDLLASIKAEKEQLIKEKKIKKEKPLAPISEDEIPFDIPDNWEWVRWGDISNSVQYGYNSPAMDYGNAKMVRISDIQNNRIIWDNVPYCKIDDNEIDTYILHDTDILFARTGGTVGKSCLVEGMPEDIPYIYAGYLIRSNYNSRLDPKYLKYFMDSELYWYQLRDGTTKNAQPNCNGKTLSKMIIPLPPLAEQHRIVARVDELMAKIDELETVEKELVALKKAFPGDMKASLLQAAMQGKLTQQLPEDGSAEDLLASIKFEKDKLIAEKKIKKDSIEALEDVPFDIPTSWCWVRLNDIVVKTVKRGKSPTYTTKSNTLVFAQKCNTKAGYINMELALFLDEGKLNKYPDDEFMQDMDIVINSTGNGTLGRVGFFRNADNPRGLRIVPDSHVTVIRPSSQMNAAYAMYCMKYYQPYFEKTCTGSTNQTELSVDTLKNLAFPLPPLAEQKRIVEKLDKLLPLCDALKEDGVA